MDSDLPGKSIPQSALDDLTELENYINDMWDFLPIPVVYITPIGVIHDVNRHFEELIGRSRLDVIGNLIGDICPAFHEEHFYAIALSSKQLRAIDSTCSRSDNSKVPVSVFLYARRDENKEVIGYFCAFIDISEKKVKEALLSKSEANYRTTIDSMLDAIHVINRDYQIVMINDTFRQWNRDLGLAADAVGRTLFDVFPFLSDKVRAEYEHVFETGKVLFTEETTKINEKAFATLTRKTPIFEAGKVVKILTEIRDVTESKLMQNALKNSEERFRIAASSASDLVWDWDIESGKIEWFGDIDRQLGYADGELERTKQAWMKVIHPADLARVLDQLEKHLLLNERYELEYRVIRKDGLVRHWTQRGNALRDPTGKSYRMISAITDITDRKASEQRCLAANERLKFLIASTSAIIYTSEIGGDYAAKFVSDNVTGILGHTPTEFVERPDFWIEHVHPGDRDRIITEVQYLFDIGTYSYEYRFLHKKGNYIWVRDEMRLVRDRSGEPIEIVGLLTDVNERRVIEEELIKSEKKYRQLVELTHEGVWVIDADSNTTFVNPQMAKMLGYDPPEMIDRSLFSFMEDRKIIDAQEYIERRKQGICEQHDFEFISKDGQRRVFLMETASLFSDDGKYAGAVAMVSDITARADAEQQIKSHLDFERIVSGISTKFINARPEEIDKIVIDSLETVGKSLEADRSYVFKISPDGEQLTNTHEWCSPGTESQKHRIQNVRTGAFKWSIDRVKKNEVIVVNNLSDLPTEAKAEKEEFEHQKIKSLIMVPMFFRGKTLGFVGLDMVNTEVVWTNTTIVTLRVIGEIFAKAFEDQRTEEQLQNTCQRLKLMLDGTVTSLAAAAEKKDPYTAGHQRRVTQLAVAIATELGFNADRIEGVRVAGTLHDIGKIYVPAEILSKPTRLTSVEYDIVKIHSKVGYDILANIDFPWPVAKTVVQHHERLDGSGYPAGLKGDEITIESRILTVADVVEAMSSHRPYRPAKGIEEAIEVILSGRGTLYDPDVVDVCVRLFRENIFKFV